MSAFSFHMHTVFPWKHITKLWKDFQIFLYSSHLGIVPISEINILPSSGNKKKLYVAEGLFDLKANGLILLYVI